MSVKAFEAIVEQGQIKLPTNIRLPENTKVYIVVPEENVIEVRYISSPRLANPEQASDFKMEVIEHKSNE